MISTMLTIIIACCGITIVLLIAYLVRLMAYKRALQKHFDGYPKAIRFNKSKPQFFHLKKHQ